ncbi:MAG: DMT family transporter [bacterium]|nr:DMT family transporter [bacterium]
MHATPLIGEGASLAAALCWAVALTQLRRPIVEHGARTINLAKMVIASGLLGATTLLAGQGGVLLHGSPSGLGLVALSGIVGLTLGDTALFAAVARLGVHRTLLFQTLAPVFAALLAIGLYGERPSAVDFAGTAVILGGVILVVMPRSSQAPSSPASTPATATFDALGIALAVVAAFGQGAGVVLAKAGMDEIPVLAASFVRLGAGGVGLVVVMVFGARLGAAARAIASPATLRQVVAPSILGTYIAFLMMMAGIAFAPASVAAVLMSTTPIFSLFIDAKVEGTPITARGLAGTLLAVAGVAVLAVSG